jgi:uncharacterized protein (DUF302 family)
VGCEQSALDKLLCAVGRHGWPLNIKRYDMLIRSLPVVAAAVLLPLTPVRFADEQPADVGRAVTVEEYGVYVSLAEGLSEEFETVVDALTSAFDSAGWALLAEYESGIDRDDCSYRSAVLVVNSSEYASSVVNMGTHAAFALPIRVIVYQDENGAHVAAANPLSLNRTIISEDGFVAQSADVVEQLKSIAATTFPGSGSSRQYGQMRNRGRISRTMGLIAGGAFTDKIETITRVRPEDGEGLSEVAHRIYEGLGDVGGSWDWDIRTVFMLDMSDQGAVVMGVTGEPMEAKAFQIVGSGNNSARSELACPGIDHAAAFPIELVLIEHDGRIAVQIIDAMFRMKMYFEDAGRVKFAANMLMPGSIEDEIRDKVEESLY